MAGIASFDFRILRTEAGRRWAHEVIAPASPREVQGEVVFEERVPPPIAVGAAMGIGSLIVPPPTALFAGAAALAPVR